MFQQLHALAKDATLLITARAEGDQLRITVTPTKEDSKKTSAGGLRPLSIIATPDELDTDFAQALTIWQGTPAAKRSVLEQAQDASEPDDEKAADKKADKKGAAPVPKKSDKPAAKDKPKGKATTTANPAAGWPLPPVASATDNAAEEKQDAGTPTDSTPSESAPPPTADPPTTAATSDESAEPAPAEPPPETEPAASTADTEFSLDLF